MCLHGVLLSPHQFSKFEWFYAELIALRNKWNLRKLYLKRFEIGVFDDNDIPFLMTDEYKFEHHSWNSKIGHWPVCQKCGLIMMKNAFSDWAVRMGCNNRDHPQYDAVRFKNTNLDKDKC